MQVDNARELRVDVCEPAQCVIEVEHGDWRRRIVGVAERHREMPAFVGVEVARVVDQHLAHRACGDRKKLVLCQVCGGGVRPQLQPRLMDQRGRVDRCGTAGAPALASREAMQFGIRQRIEVFLVGDRGRRCHRVAWSVEAEIVAILAQPCWSLR